MIHALMHLVLRLVLLTRCHLALRCVASLLRVPILPPRQVAASPIQVFFQPFGFSGLKNLGESQGADPTETPKLLYPSSSTYEEEMFQATLEDGPLPLPTFDFDDEEERKIGGYIVVYPMKKKGKKLPSVHQDTDEDLLIQAPMEDNITPERLIGILLSGFILSGNCSS